MEKRTDPWVGYNSTSSRELEAFDGSQKLRVLEKGFLGREHLLAIDSSVLPLVERPSREDGGRRERDFELDEGRVGRSLEGDERGGDSVGRGDGRRRSLGQEERHELLLGRLEERNVLWQPPRESQLG